MKIKEIETRKLNRGILENYMDRYCSKINVYGKCNNMIFMMIGQNALVYDLENNKVVISNRRGIAYPVVDKDDNKSFMIITSFYGDDSYCRNHNQPSYRDTARSYCYDIDFKLHNLECYCNIFDINNRNIHPMNKYLANIYDFNNMLEGDRFYKTIKYRDIENEDTVDDNNKYTTYEDLPIRLDNEYERVFNSYAIKEEFSQNILNKKDENFNLEIMNKKGKYSVIDSDRNINISFDKDITDIKIIDSDLIMLINSFGKKALYDINKGYLINFDDNITFDKVCKLDDNIFSLCVDGKYKLLINNNLFSDIYSDIYMTNDNLIVLEKFNKILFYDTCGTLIFGIDSKDFYKIKNDIFYCENNECYHYNLKTGIKMPMAVMSLFKLEDGTTLNLSISEVLENYTHYYNGDFDEVTDFTLFKNKKYGIRFTMEIGVGKNMKTNRWFDSRNDREEYLRLLLESLLDTPIVDNVECKKKVRKMD